MYFDSSLIDNIKKHDIKKHFGSIKLVSLIFSTFKIFFTIKIKNVIFHSIIINKLFIYLNRSSLRDIPWYLDKKEEN